MKKALAAMLLLLVTIAAAGGCGAASRQQPASTIRGGMPVAASLPDDAALSGADVSRQGDGGAFGNLLATYYGGQNDRAFGMIQKGIFKDMLRGWAAANLGDGIEQPTWNFDTFARYQILDRNWNPVAGHDALYYCTFSESGGGYGYFCVSYEQDEEGGGLRRVGGERTLHPYDLRACMEDIVQKLAETGLDPASTTASRVRLVDAGGDSGDEAILFADDNGAKSVYYLASSELAP